MRYNIDGRDFEAMYYALGNKCANLEREVLLLLDDVAARHGIDHRDEFICPFMHDLADTVDWRRMRVSE